MKRPCARLLALAGLLLAAPPARLALALELALPIACEPGRTCLVQNYVDDDPGPGVRDWACGAATYDGHKGTDIRLRSLEAAAGGTVVLAAAAGIVKGTRDGMAERLVAGPDDLAGIKGRECGNGVVIDHGGGWETQYCHMRRGSIAVRTGERVDEGTRLGEVGASGNTQFAHLHFEVRKDGRPVDPFLGPGGVPACATGGTAVGTAGAGGVDDAATPGTAEVGAADDEAMAPAGSEAAGAGGATGASAGDPAAAPASDPARPLWRPAVLAALGPPASAILEAGFSASLPDKDRLELGHAGLSAPRAGDRQLLFFARLINLRAGDRVRLRLEGPGGVLAGSEGEPLPRAKAVWLSYAGRKNAQGWPAGTYTGRVEVMRDGQVVLAKAEQVVLGE